MLTEAHATVARSPGEGPEDPADVGRGPERQSAANQKEREGRAETAREGCAQDHGGRGHGGHQTTAAGQAGHGRAGQTQSRRCSPFRQLSLYMGVMGNHQRVGILGVCSSQHMVTLESIR